MKKKDRGFRHVTSTAKLVIREALPIQCVEAVFVGAYLTAGMKEASLNEKKKKTIPTCGTHTYYRMVRLDRSPRGRWYVLVPSSCIVLMPYAKLTRSLLVVEP